MKEQIKILGLVLSLCLVTLILVLTGGTNNAKPGVILTGKPPLDITETPKAYLMHKLDMYEDGALVEEVSYPKTQEVCPTEEDIKTTLTKVSLEFEPEKVSFSDIISGIIKTPITHSATEMVSLEEFAA